MFRSRFADVSPVVLGAFVGYCWRSSSAGEDIFGLTANGRAIKMGPTHNALKDRGKLASKDPSR